ncbi:hypothetical protein ACHAQH_008278 [Verticillium albo-atrum]
MHIPTLALAALLVPALAFEITSPAPESTINLDDTSITFTWDASEGGPDGYNSLDLEWLLQSPGERVDGALYSVSQFIAQNISQPRTTSYEWNPEQAREVLRDLLPQTDGTVKFYVMWYLASPNPNIGRGGSRVEYKLEGVEESSSGAGILAVGVWGAVGAGLAAAAWAA